MQIGIKDLLDSSFALEKYATNQFKEINQTYKDKIKGILKNYAYPSLLEKGKGWGAETKVFRDALNE